MLKAAKISLVVPDQDKSQGYFSFYIKQYLVDERIEYQQQKRIIVISGNIKSFKDFYKFLFKNKVINKYLNWTYSDGHLVIIGNDLNQGSELIDCWWLLYSLEEQAFREGGYVHFLASNQAKKGLDNSWRYKHPSYTVRKSGAKNSATALYYGNNELWHWLRTKNSMEKIGSTLFVEDSTLLESNSDIPGGKEKAEELLAKFDAKTIVAVSTRTDKVVSYFDGKLISIPICSANTWEDILLIKGKHFYRKSIGRQRKRIK